MKALLRKIRQILKDRRTRKIFTRFISTVAAIVVFVTTYALVLPAITMESQAMCGIEAHQHSDSCYEKRLTCGLEESETHTHTDSCYEKVLVCGKENHTHSTACYHLETATAGAPIEITGVASTESAALAATETASSDPAASAAAETTSFDPASSAETGSQDDSSLFGTDTSSHAGTTPANTTSADTIDPATNSALTDTSNTEFTEDSADTEDTTNTEDKSSTGTPLDPEDNTAADPADTAATEASADPENRTDTSETSNADPSSADPASEDFSDASHTTTSDQPTTDTNDTTSQTTADTPAGTDPATTVAPANPANGATNTTAAPSGYVPALEELNFNTILNKNTTVYYHHQTSDDKPAEVNPADDAANKTIAEDTADGTEVEPAADARVDDTEVAPTADSAADDTEEMPAADSTTDDNENKAAAEIIDWKQTDKNTVLGENDLLRVYLAYAIPAGSLNETNPTARYRLPENIHLTDAQIDAINTNVNGIAAQYINYETLEITDLDAYNKTLGIEAVDGDRTPADDLNEYLQNHDNEEFISATVRAEKDTVLGTDLVFTFSPYAISKNQHEYDKDGKPTRAGEKIKGWVCLDLTIDQIDWTEVPEDSAENLKSAEIIFAAKDKELGIDKISTELKADYTTATAQGEETPDASAKAAEENAKTEKDSALNEKDKEESEEAKDESEDTDNYPAISFDDRITVYAGTLSSDTEETDRPQEQTELTVHIEAEEGTFPEGTTMKLSTVEDMDSVAEAVGTAVEGQTKGFHAVDIAFYNTEGLEIEPLKPIKVSMTSEAIKQAVEDTSTVPVVVHVEDTAKKSEQETQDAEEDSAANNNKKDTAEASGSTELTGSIMQAEQSTQSEASAQSNDQASEGDAAVDTLTFEAGTFSVYAVVYTVDFHYEVNGKTYEFSIPGGGFISLEHLVEVLGIGKADSNIGNELEESNPDDNNEYTSEDKLDTETNTDAYDEAIRLNEVEVSQASKNFVTGVVNVEFSNPDLVWVDKVSEPSSIGTLKEINGLEIEYSADLSEKQIAEINAQTVKAGDWALITMQPFTSEENLVVTMSNGDQWTVKVTDVNNVSVDSTFDGTEGFVIYTIKNGKYYALNNQTGNNWYLPNGEADLETLGNEFKWTIEYVYQEKGQGYFDNSFDIGYNYYKVRSYLDRSKYLFVGREGSVVRQEATNVHIIPNPNPGQSGTYAIGGRFDFMWAHWLSALAVNDAGAFYPYPASAEELEPRDKYAPIYIYQQNAPTYEITVQTDNIEHGYVTGLNTAGELAPNDAIYITKTSGSGSSIKKNRYDISAVPQTNRIKFKNWTLDGVKINVDTTFTTIINAKGLQVTAATIPADKLPVGHDGAILEAHFEKNEAYQPTDDDINGRNPIYDKTTFHEWLNDRIGEQKPLESVNKTAEVYDYENRIYRVDLTAQSKMTILDGDVDLGFVIDVSSSMRFPSKLKNADDLGNNKNTPQDLTKINDVEWNNKTKGENWGLKTNKTYYVITDPESTATICKLWYDRNSKVWKMQDSSKIPSDKNQNIFQPDNTSPGLVYWDDNKPHTLLIKEADDFVHKTGQNKDTGTITTTESYKEAADGAPKTRAMYLEASIKDAISEMYQIKQELSVASNSSATTAKQDYAPKIAYNTFCEWVNPLQYDFIPAPKNGLDITYTYKGGTSTDMALVDAAGYKRDDVGDNVYKSTDNNAAKWSRNPVSENSYHKVSGKGFNWDPDSNKRYVVLITDGAPQRKSQNIDTELLKDGRKYLHESNAKLISVGLSMGDCKVGAEKLYIISDDDANYVPYYYKAESGDMLTNALYDILQTTVGDAIVTGNVTDTIGQAFYPVDKKTGNPLNTGDWINLNGEKVNKNTYTGKHGVINVTRQTKNGKQEDVYTVNWEDQDIKTKDNGGWHGTVYVKAKEDLIGGNGIKTNDGQASIRTTGFKNKENTISRELKQEYRIEKKLESPRVNVNELSITSNNTEWSVYVGEQVDPLDELKKLYKQMDVIQVIKSGTDRNNDNLIDKVSSDTNSYHSRNENMYYPLPASLNEMESDSREGQASGTPLTFKLKDLIKSLTGSEELNWDKLLSEANKTGTDQEHPEDMNQGVEIRYNPYGINDESKLIFKLTKEIVDNEPDITKNAHRTNVVGDGVEKYTLTVYYEPDYKVLPTGQYGEADIATYHVGPYESQSQGNATGRETKENKHVINVYAKSFDILKLYDQDDKNSVVQGAEFRLYRAAKGTESIDDAEFLSKYSLSGMHCIDAQTTNEYGIATMAAVSDGKTSSELLNVNDGPYYLIEYSAPAGYKKDEKVRQITVTTNDNSFKDVKGVVINSSALDSSTHKPKVAYNWEQGMRLSMTNGTVIVANPDTHQAVTLPGNRAYVKEEDNVTFQTEIINIKATSINIKKADEKGNGLAEAVFQLKVVKNGTDVLVKTDDDYKNIEGVGDVTIKINGQTKTFGSAVKSTGEIQNITGLLDGTYKLVEAAAPSGYIITSPEIVFTVSNGVITSSTASNSDKVKLDPATGTTVALLTVINEPGVELPSTGGPGTTHLYLLGLILTALAGAGLAMRHRTNRNSRAA